MIYATVDTLLEAARTARPPALAVRTPEGGILVLAIPPGRPHIALRDALATVNPTPAAAYAAADPHGFASIDLRSNETIANDPSLAEHLKRELLFRMQDGEAMADIYAEIFRRAKLPPSPTRAEISVTGMVQANLLDRHARDVEAVLRQHDEPLSA